MKKLTLGILLILSAPVNAQMLGVKAGLWETKLVHQIVDGKDMAPQMAALQAKMQETLAKMTPEQRAQMGPMFKNMLGQNGVMRTCISAASAAKQSAMIDPEGHCTASSVNTSGNKMTFSFSCNQDGHTTSGTGERIVNGGAVSTHMDITSTNASGPHKVVTDTVMTYLGADCQGVMPLDQMMKSMQAQHP